MVEKDFYKMIGFRLKRYRVKRFRLLLKKAKPEFAAELEVEERLTKGNSQKKEIGKITNSTTTITPKMEPKTIIEPDTDLFNGIVAALSGLSDLKDYKVAQDKPVRLKKVTVLSMDDLISRVTVNVSQ